ncbi:protein of unknown function [Hyphomicrobium sp. MC1]|nr:protein of unknown function [Hyphomicrobium sp. MC1]
MGCSKPSFGHIGRQKLSAPNAHGAGALAAGVDVIRPSYAFFNGPMLGASHIIGFALSVSRCYRNSTARAIAHGYRSSTTWMVK